MGHRLHWIRKRVRDFFDPFDQIRQSHGRSVRQTDPAQLRSPGRFRQSGSMTVWTDPFLQILFHPLHALFIFNLGKGIFNGPDRTEVGKVHLSLFLRVRIEISHMLLDRRSVQNDLLFLIGQVLVGDIGPDPHQTADVLHQRPHKGPPDGNGSLIDGQVFIGDQGAFVYRTDDPRAPAGGAGSGTVKSQVFGPRPVKLGSAHGADDRSHRSDRKRRRAVMAVRAAMAGQSGKHKPETVQELGHGAEGAADARYPRPLVQGQGSRDVTDIIYIRPSCLGHAPSGISRQGFQIPPGSFGIQYPQCQRRLA